jgi:hypothetical protein
MTPAQSRSKQVRPPCEILPTVDSLWTKIFLKSACPFWYKLDVQKSTYLAYVMGKPRRIIRKSGSYVVLIIEPECTSCPGWQRQHYTRQLI